MLRRAGELFRQDKEDERAKKRDAEIAPLRKEMQRLEALMEEGDFGAMDAYETVMHQVHELERGSLEEGQHEVSPQWTNLMEALGEVPRTYDPNYPPKPANLRLLIDAMKRVEEDSAKQSQDRAAK